ncbi:MAG: 50S ribosomal protein L29 [Acidobacteriota bacterium]|jgi:large subunit ribosomal protein L29|uniref:Large ribosomal subunit protein uL29 n=1 Tax=Thermoanaerobaculum aquaticum TaxID=1312852 RepID=A0A062Y1J9_9BACT|nr:50S ribosomal protein L29 [Thermoanaerobaculum aquaticum]KDA54655.1 50S ribosomal protein L29 [Thermoanaerobaculum aquaticum]BCW92948.1 MAG: 50S ribosomal protein L29 [Thermoanaerobaculum sp.]GBC78946.1 50S ribosomal protein L29 [bacterium HR09]
MKAKQLRDQSIEELRRTEADLLEQLFKLRFQRATGQMENPGKIRQVRRDIARVKTVLLQRLREVE